MNIRIQFQHKISIWSQELIRHQQQKYKKLHKHKKQHFSSLKYTNFWKHKRHWLITEWSHCAQHSSNQPQTQLDWADSDTSNWPQVGEAGLSATCSHPNLSEPVNKGSKKCIIMGNDKRAKSCKSGFTNTGNPLYLFQCYHTASSLDRHHSLLLAPCTTIQ
jgi:hypothetical protein